MCRWIRRLSRRNEGEGDLRRDLGVDAADAWADWISMLIVVMIVGVRGNYLLGFLGDMHAFEFTHYHQLLSFALWHTHCVCATPHCSELGRSVVEGEWTLKERKKCGIPLSTQLFYSYSSYRLHIFLLLLLRDKSAESDYLGWVAAGCDWRRRLWRLRKLPLH